MFLALKYDKLMLGNLRDENLKNVPKSKSELGFLMASMQKTECLASCDTSCLENLVIMIEEPSSQQSATNFSYSSLIGIEGYKLELEKARVERTYSSRSLIGHNIGIHHRWR